MATRESELRDKTYKEEGFEVGERVFHTLFDSGTPDKSIRAIALLIEELHRSGTLNDTQIDNLLLKIVR
jgi:hypothetical protein